MEAWRRCTRARRSFNLKVVVSFRHSRPLNVILMPVYTRAHNHIPFNIPNDRKPPTTKVGFPSYKT